MLERVRCGVVVQEPALCGVAGASARMLPRWMRLVATSAVVVQSLSLVLSGSSCLCDGDQWRTKHHSEVKRILRDVAETFRADTFAAYRKASSDAEQAVALEPGFAISHVYLAYADTVRWCEHEGSDELRVAAEGHLAEARRLAAKSGVTVVQFDAAEALYVLHSGRGSEARKALDDVVARLEAERKRPATLFLTQGIVELTLGDFEAARAALQKAQAILSDDPRTLVTLGELERQSENDAAALAHFEAALVRTGNSHHGAHLGLAFVLLDRPQLGESAGAAAKSIAAVLESEPPASPFQLAEAHFLRALLVSRASAELAKSKSPETQQVLARAMAASGDKVAVLQEIEVNERAGGNLAPRNPRLRLVRARRLLHEGDVDAAAAELERGIAADGSVATFRLELAKLRARKERGAEAARSTSWQPLPTLPR